MLNVMPGTTEADHIAAVKDRLAAAMPNVPASHIDAAVAEQHAHFEGRSIRDFVPLFVERRARERLRGTAV